jgi:hypothetical protein
MRVVVAAVAFVLVVVVGFLGYKTFVETGVTANCATVAELEASGVEYGGHAVEYFNGVPYVCFEI